MSEELTHRDRTTDLGAVRINNEAISTIASLAAMEVKGVQRMGGGLARTLYEIFTRRAQKGVTIDMRESEVRLTVSIIVDYGVNIPKIADEVQENVKRAVEKMAGLLLAEVNIVVEGVQAPQGGEKKQGGLA